MVHPTPKNLLQATLMIMHEYVEEWEHQEGEGVPFADFDQIDGLARMTQDLGLYMQKRQWDDERDNPALTDKNALCIVANLWSIEP